MKQAYSIIIKTLFIVHPKITENNIKSREGLLGESTTKVADMARTQQCLRAALALAS